MVDYKKYLLSNNFYFKITVRFLIFYEELDDYKLANDNFMAYASER